MARVIERFNVKNALLFQEVEKRHNYDHVLEIFERVNSGGMVLDKSDLLFSTIKLKLQGMERKFIEAVNFLNQGARHNFNTDFLIKTSLVVFGQKAKYDVEKLKDSRFTGVLEAGGFGECRATHDRPPASIRSGRSSSAPSPFHPGVRR